jgi:hypothetical protein
VVLARLRILRLLVDRRVVVIRLGHLLQSLKAKVVVAQLLRHSLLADHSGVGETQVTQIHTLRKVADHVALALSNVLQTLTGAVPLELVVELLKRLGLLSMSRPTCRNWGRELQRGLPLHDLHFLLLHVLLLEGWVASVPAWLDWLRHQ